MDLDNVDTMVSNISKFATTIFVDLFTHKGKEENNDNTRMKHFGPSGSLGIKKFKVGIVDFHAVGKDGVQIFLTSKSSKKIPNLNMSKKNHFVILDKLILTCPL